GTWQPHCQPLLTQSLGSPSLTGFLANRHTKARPPNTSSVASFLPYISNAIRTRLMDCCDLPSANRGAASTHPWEQKFPRPKNAVVFYGRIRRCVWRSTKCDT